MPQDDLYNPLAVIRAVLHVYMQMLGTLVQAGWGTAVAATALAERSFATLLGATLGGAEVRP